MRYPSELAQGCHPDISWPGGGLDANGFMAATYVGGTWGPGMLIPCADPPDERSGPYVRAGAAAAQAIRRDYVVVPPGDVPEHAIMGGRSTRPL